MVILLEIYFGLAGCFFIVTAAYYAVMQGSFLLAFVHLLLACLSLGSGMYIRITREKRTGSERR